VQAGIDWIGSGNDPYGRIGDRSRENCMRSDVAATVALSAPDIIIRMTMIKTTMIE
jgi:hypothetical protein